MEHIDIQILETALDPDICMKWVQDPAAGGIVNFIGTVRRYTQKKEVVHLEFESYRPMALKEMTKIAEEMLRKAEILKISMHHRLGLLGVGEIAVIISVSAAHRKAAFEACSFAIDSLKQTVPIWKKEVFKDGEVWVAAHP